MENELSQKNRERLLQIGTAIAYLRKKCGLSQEKLAAKAGISRSLLSSIEANSIAKNFTLEIFFNLADALEIEPKLLMDAKLSLETEKDDNDKSFS